MRKVIFLLKNAVEKVKFWSFKKKVVNLGNNFPKSLIGARREGGGRVL